MTIVALFILLYINIIILMCSFLRTCERVNSVQTLSIYNIISSNSKINLVSTIV